MRSRQRPHHQLRSTNAWQRLKKRSRRLEQIERQVAEMESASPDAATRREIAKLQERIDTLTARNERATHCLAEN